jgi:hypothetical protein
MEFSIFGSFRWHLRLHIMFEGGLTSCGVEESASEFRLYAAAEK